ncbi:unnamed protein product [Paramecium sonneborni]|uniref:Uncharacterized protein n=1 Tax=Paramecium sonneborni TaxID=65129 RepID=A0A8S1JV48_9CILI|nr:unnamed protein product [Paramecium sonneborni]CAD8046301.1 unnamed protein product [Paramecium sonneborni]
MQSFLQIVNRSLLSLLQFNRTITIAYNQLEICSFYKNFGFPSWFKLYGIYQCPKNLNQKYISATPRSHQRSYLNPKVHRAITSTCSYWENPPRECFKQKVEKLTITDKLQNARNPIKGEYYFLLYKFSRESAQSYVEVAPNLCIHNFIRVEMKEELIVKNFKMAFEE